MEGLVLEMLEEVVDLRSISSRRAGDSGSRSWRGRRDRGVGRIRVSRDRGRRLFYIPKNKSAHGFIWKRNLIGGRRWLTASDS